VRPLQWERVLAEHRVPYITAGPNVKRGELNIRCPFCGSADPSYHMGLNLDTGWWACWRNRAQHSGKSPLRLLMKLLRVPYAQAREIAGLGSDYVDPEGFDAVAARMLQRGEDARPGSVERRVLHLGEDFDPITSHPRLRRFWNYLYQRGFSGSSRLGEDVDVLCSFYKLHAGDGSTKQWGWLAELARSRHPAVLPGRKLVTWTGRAITPSSKRYQDLATELSLVGATKETLYNHDAIYAGGKALVLVEGPFDVLKLDFYGMPWGVRSVGLSTNSISESQAFLLQPAAAKFDRVIVMMDDADGLGIVDSMRMEQELQFLPNVSIHASPRERRTRGAHTQTSYQLGTIP
jgi:hypothetical protein